MSPGRLIQCSARPTLRLLSGAGRALEEAFLQLQLVRRAAPRSVLPSEHHPAQESSPVSSRPRVGTLVELPTSRESPGVSAALGCPVPLGTAATSVALPFPCSGEEPSLTGGR